jgi:hypothetical protein
LRGGGETNLRKFVLELSSDYSKRFEHLSFLQDLCVVFIIFCFVIPYFIFYLKFSYDVYCLVTLFCGLVVLVCSIAYKKLKVEFNYKLNKLFSDVSALLTKFGTDACVFELISSWWKGLKERIRQVYPEVPEFRVMNFINEWIDSYQQIRQQTFDNPEMRELQLNLAWETLMKKHGIPLVFSVHKAENIAGGAFFIVSFRRPDADERAFLEAIKQTAKLYATTEAKSET